MSVIVVATIRPLPEHQDEVVAAFVAAIPQVHDEPGCELYALHQGDGRLVMIEKWESGAALGAHSTSAALVALGAQLEGKLSEPLDVQVMQAVPAGAEALGTV
ncbi:MAG: putative quinol monooxygenase [Aeromicrobium sp.]